MSKSDISVWLITFTLTVVADLTLAMQVGMTLAALLFIRKVSATTTVEEITHEDLTDGRIHVVQDHAIPEYVGALPDPRTVSLRLDRKARDITDRVDELPPVVILRLREMSAIDATGAHRAGGDGRPASRARPLAHSLRRARAAQTTDGSGRVLEAHRRGESLRTHRGSAWPGHAQSTRRTRRARWR